MPNADGLALIEGSDCLGCHKVDQVSIGPAYAAVAAKYARDSTALPRLAAKIRTGGTGVWGKVMMPAHAQLRSRRATDGALHPRVGATRGRASDSAPPCAGATSPDSASATSGAIVLRTAYTDNGANGRLGVTTETSLLLRAPTLSLAEGELSEGGGGAGRLPTFTVIWWRRVGRAPTRGSGHRPDGRRQPADHRRSARPGECRWRNDRGPARLAHRDAARHDGRCARRRQATRHVAPAGTANAGVHDVYLIFRNTQAASGQLLFFLSTLHLER
ncbi:MAG: hypothetical protein IPK33_23555 [Gemmatimonadetes bacterium]|nr:hypothetical protein [Gemmatimonadota bacterium]